MQSAHLSHFEKTPKCTRWPSVGTVPCSFWQDTLEPLTVCESKRYFFREDLHPNPEIGKQFHFYHPDLGPGNIIISNNQISAIIDWEAAGFSPRFWISTKPSVSPGLDFYPPIPGVDDIEWRRRLRMKLEEQGYPRFADWFMEWRKSKSRWTDIRFLVHSDWTQEPKKWTLRSPEI